MTKRRSAEVPPGPRIEALEPRLLLDALTVNITGFPVPSVTPHLRLATIVDRGERQR